MNKKKIVIQSFILFTLCTLPVSFFEDLRSAYAFSGQIIRRGTIGDDVIELQSRLQYIGFYRGKINGVFDWGTYWALRNFQNSFGLPVDGFAGANTKAALTRVSSYNEQYVKSQMYKNPNFSYYGGGTNQSPPAPVTNNSVNPAAPKKANNSTAVNTPNGFSQNDIQLMANAVNGESRGEPFIGQVAVAAVILNRVHDPRFPNTIAGVIFQPGAFTAVSDGQIWLTPDSESKKAVIDAINGWDPSGYAIYYFNPATATSPWIWGRPQIKKIGKHIFCR